jgi:transposase
MTKTRRIFTADQKAEVVRRHVGDKVPVGDLAAEFDIQPGQIHQWVESVLAQADRAFEVKRGRKGKDPASTISEAKDRQIKQLQDKLQRKNEVISELMEENIKAKKEFGDL